MPHLRRQACCFAAARSPLPPHGPNPQGPSTLRLDPPHVSSSSGSDRPSAGRSSARAYGRAYACCQHATRRAAPRHATATPSPRLCSSPPRPRSLVASRRVASRGGCTQRTHGPWVVAVVDLLGAGRDRPAVDATHAVTQSVRRGLAALLAWRRGGGGGGRSKCQRRRQEQDTAAPGFAPPCRAIVRRRPGDPALSIDVAHMRAQAAAVRTVSSYLRHAHLYIRRYVTSHSVQTETSTRTV
jgi:hypothetical protein